jgi:hypothetical protein
LFGENIAIGHLDCVYPPFLPVGLVGLLDILHRPTLHHLVVVRMVGCCELAGIEGEGVLPDDVHGWKSHIIGVVRIAEQDD